MKQSLKDGKVSVVFMQLALLFTVCLIAANIFEAKEIAVGPINLTGGLLVFPLTYVICRIVCEVWGFQRTCLLIWMGFLLNFLLMVVAVVVDMIPGAPDSAGSGFHEIFGIAPRITIASCVAFLAGSFVSAYTMSRRKVRNKGARLGGRLALSAVLGEAADSLLFFPIAFLGVLTTSDLLGQLAFQFVLKTLYEIVLIPVTVPLIRRLKKFEGEDAFDENISYGLFDVFKRK